jgi:hypothetical protein
MWDGGIQAVPPLQTYPQANLHPGKATQPTFLFQFFEQNSSVHLSLAMAVEM